MCEITLFETLGRRKASRFYSYLRQGYPVIYQYISAIGRFKPAGSPWMNLDLTGLSMSQIYALYDEAYIVLQSAAWSPAQRCVKLADLRPFITDYSKTLLQLLEQIGNRTIPSQVKLPKIKWAKVKTSDAFWSGYKLKRAKYSQNPEIEVSPHEADCFVMQKPEVDPRDFYKYCLVTINGLIHRTDADSRWIYVIDAQKSSLHSGRNEVGIINFKAVGGLELISITPSMVHRRFANQPMKNQLYIKAPKPATNKTVALVFGGYLYLLDSLVFSRVADDIFMFDTQSAPMLERYYESSELMDMKALGLTTAGAHNKQIIKEQLLSDEVLKKWISMSQSFLVYIDNDCLEVKRELLARSYTHGQYVAYKEPTNPLVIGYGLMPSYWKTPDEGQWAINVTENLRDNYLFATVPAAKIISPADNREPMRPIEISKAQLLEISSTLLYFE